VGQEHSECQKQSPTRRLTILALLYWTFQTLELCGILFKIYNPPNLWHFAIPEQIKWTKIVDKYYIYSFYLSYFKVINYFLVSF
jgi:hypothetical protein